MYRCIFQYLFYHTKAPRWRSVGYIIASTM